MRIALDFDGTLVEEDHAFDDLQTPLRLKRGALKALRELKEAGHVLILHSGRSNRALREDWRLNPLWASGAVRFDAAQWLQNAPLHQARYEQMVRFAHTELAGLIDAVDDGRQGKPMVDLFIDDRAVCLGMGAKALTWPQIADRYGDKVFGDEGSDVG